MQNRRKASVGGKSNYENINFDGWSAEGYAIGITKYDGKSLSLYSHLNSLTLSWEQR